MEKIKKYFPYFYIAFLLFSFFYIKGVLKEGDIEEYDDDTGNVQKVIDIDAILVADGKFYKSKQRSDDTILDLLEDLRSHTDFYYEKTDYIYGTEINMVNGKKAPEGYKWELVFKDEILTKDIGDIFLQDDQTYNLELVKE